MCILDFIRKLILDSLCYVCSISLLYSAIVIGIQFYIKQELAKFLIMGKMLYTARTGNKKKLEYSVRT